MKKIVFIDKNKRLVNKVKKALGESKVQVKHGDIFAERGVIVSASNPNFTMGGGLDALIARKYPKECAEARNTPGKNKRIGDVIFTITVDNKLKSNIMLVRKALNFAKRNLKKNETLLVSGLGTGIGGLSYKAFANAFVEVFGNKQKTPKDVVTRYKFLREGLVSHYGTKTWRIGEWYHEDEISLCNKGFHASARIVDALGYVQGAVLTVVECGGDRQVDSDKTKEVFQDMRVVKAYAWTKEDSVALSIYAAEQVIGIYEKEYLNDDRPRKAIEAAKNWLKNPTADSAARSAAYAASAVRAAYSAASAASAAYHAAYSAAYAASAASAAYHAASAVRAARSAAIKKRIDKWLLARISKLQKIK